MKSVWQSKLARVPRLAFLHINTLLTLGKIYGILYTHISTIKYCIQKVKWLNTNIHRSILKMVNKTSVTFISYSHQRFPAQLKPDLKVVSHFAIYCSNSTIATMLFVNYKRGSQYFRRGMEFESRNIKGF
jgi:hypothetical protein